MAKSVWEGHLRLSLVTCPASLYKATDPRSNIAFRLLNPKTGSRIVQVVKDPTTGEELDRKTLVKGFEISKDKYVVFEQDELKALRIESTHVLDLERFVDAASIDRIYWDEPYYLAPSDKTGIEAFAVILDAMRRKDRIGIGRLVLNTRERMCALEPRENCFLLTSLRTHEDIIAIHDIDGITKLPKPDRQMLEIAEKIIEQQGGKFEPSTFKDRYEDAVRDLIAQKKKGQKVTTAQPAERGEGKVIDLMDALRRSLASKRGGPGSSAGPASAHRKARSVASARPGSKKGAA